jgi:hypothetical protein
MTIARPSQSVFQLSSGLLPELPEQQPLALVEPTPSASMLQAVVSVQQAALLWRRLNRQAQSPYHRQRWLTLVLKESPVVLILVLLPQEFEV